MRINKNNSKNTFVRITIDFFFNILRTPTTVQCVQYNSGFLPDIILLLIMTRCYYKLSVIN